MRISLKNSKLFFDEILEYRNIKLKDLSLEIKESYSTLKQYRRGNLTIPENIFNKIIIFSKRKNYWKTKTNILEDNWGALKAGKISAKKGNMKRRMSHARSFKEKIIVNININKFFCEFYGALLGDGCITRFRDYENTDRFYIVFSGNKKLDSEYLKKLKLKIEKEFRTYVYYYEYKNKNVCTLSIKNKGLALELNKSFEVPIGLKYKKLKISKKILCLDWNLKKYFIRGLFDTDGSIYARKDESYRWPIISISSKSEKFRNEIKNMLRERGYPAYISSSNVAIRGISAVKRWFSDIGSSNQRNIFKYKYWLKNKVLPPKTWGPII